MFRVRVTVRFMARAQFKAGLALWLGLQLGLWLVIIRFGTRVRFRL
jgi:hypothetical protein